jgi:hypothetical protein
VDASGGQRTFWKRFSGLSKTFWPSAACKGGGSNDYEGGGAGVDEPKDTPLLSIITQ